MSQPTSPFIETLDKIVADYNRSLKWVSSSPRAFAGEELG